MNRQQSMKTPVHKKLLPDSFILFLQERAILFTLAPTAIFLMYGSRLRLLKKYTKGSKLSSFREGGSYTALATLPNAEQCLSHSGLSPCTTFTCNCRDHC